MIRKTINKNCETVHNELVKSITDPVVEAKVRDNTMISGGAIASMLLGEEVNDYDFYFTNFEAAKAIAEYYVKKFIEKSKTNVITPEVNVEDGRVRIIVRSTGMAEQGDATEAADCEMPNPENSKKKKSKTNFDPIYLSENAITLKGNIQIIIRFYGEPDEIHKHFDFVHCLNYWTPHTKLVLQPTALEALLTKQLTYIGSKYPICSLIRMRKFIQRGWKINAGQILKMCFQISKLDLTNINILRDQLTGVDVAYFRQLIEACESELQNNTEIDEGYICQLIDKIF